MGKKSKPILVLNSVLTIVILLLIVAIVLLIFVVSPMTVSGDSMLNTLHDGERIWIKKNVEEFHRGDIVVFKREGDNKNVVKRIIAMEGDTVSFNLTDGYIINGEPLVEEYIKNPIYNKDYFLGSKQDVNVLKWLTTSGITLEKDQIFVLGDNREVSYDSHRYGPININEIKGKVL